MMKNIRKQIIDILENSLKCKKSDNICFDGTDIYEQYICENYKISCYIEIDKYDIWTNGLNILDIFKMEDNDSNFDSSKEKISQHILTGNGEKLLTFLKNDPTIISYIRKNKLNKLTK